MAQRSARTTSTRRWRHRKRRRAGATGTLTCEPDRRRPRAIDKVWIYRELPALRPTLLNGSVMLGQQPQEGRDRRSGGPPWTGKPIIMVEEINGAAPAVRQVGAVEAAGAIKKDGHGVYMQKGRHVSVPASPSATSGPLRQDRQEVRHLSDARPVELGKVRRARPTNRRAHVCRTLIRSLRASSAKLASAFEGGDDGGDGLSHEPNLVRSWGPGLDLRIRGLSELCGTPGAGVKNKIGTGPCSAYRSAGIVPALMAIRPSRPLTIRSSAEPSV